MLLYAFNRRHLQFRVVVCFIELEPRQVFILQRTVFTLSTTCLNNKANRAVYQQNIQCILDYPCVD